MIDLQAQEEVNIWRHLIARHSLLPIRKSISGRAERAQTAGKLAVCVHEPMRIILAYGASAMQEIKHSYDVSSSFR